MRTRPDASRLKIDRKTAESNRKYAAVGEHGITGRVAEFDKEWGIERWLELNVSTIAGIGLPIMALTQNLWWRIIPGIILPFLFLHAVHGWCPPIPIMRRMGIRARKAIDEEKHGAKALRGDYHGATYKEASGDRVVAYPAAANTGGRRSAHGRAVSNCAAKRNSVASSPNRPIKCAPIGSPSAFQYNGTFIAG